MTATQKLMLALALIALGAGAGWTAQGWRKDARIADMERGQAEINASQYKAALDDLVAASKRIDDAAAGARLDLATVTGQLDTLRKEFKNAPPVALPDDCKPDAARVRRLNATAAAIDKAIAGPVTGGAMPPEWPAGGR